MVRDVRGHTFSSLDSLWSLWKETILPRASKQYELMTQRNVHATNALGQLFELAHGPTVWECWLSADPTDYLSKSVTPRYFLQLFFDSFFAFSSYHLTGKLLNPPQRLSSSSIILCKTLCGRNPCVLDMVIPSATGRRVVRSFAPTGITLGWGSAPFATLGRWRRIRPRRERTES